MAYNFPATNVVLAEAIDTLGKLMDIFGENAFKTKAYTSGAYALKKLPQNVVDLSREEIGNLKALSSSIQAKVLELLDTGTLEALEAYKLKVPEGVLDMMRIKGLGPKKIAVLWKELGIASIGELQYACEENRLMTYKGFGAKTQADILKNIQFFQTSMGYYLWKQIDDIWMKWVDKWTAFADSNTWALVGDYPRQMTTVGRVEILTEMSPAQITNFLEQHAFQSILNNEDRVDAQDEFGIPWRFTTSHKDTLGLKAVEINSSSSFWEALQSKGTLPATASTEGEVFQQMNIPFIPAYLRESSDINAEIELVQGGQLIQTAAIKGIIHSHSTWSDGMHSIKEMALAAQAMGMEYLVMSDHSKSAFYANGLSVERILEQHKEIVALNIELAPFKIFKSIEADILNDGSLDYEPEVLALFDLVIASIHSNLNMTQEKAMERLLPAIANPYTTILGHPTGRLLLSRPGYPVDFETLINACKQHEVVLEINAHPRRLDIDWTWVSLAQEKGVRLSINPDAHAIDHLGLIHYGAKAAQKGGLLSTNNLSSMSLQEFETYLQSVKSKKGIA